MGMYDTINGEQVKCFPWVSLYHNAINYHGGSLAYFNNGKKVPYKKPHYNYGKNFVILDVNQYPDSDYCEYDYVIHVIVNGKVKKTYVDKIGKINWSKNELVVGYRGELLNIKSTEDIKNFISAYRYFISEYDKIHSHYDELFRESSNYLWGIARLENGSEEKIMRQNKLEELHELMQKEKARIRPEIDKIRKDYDSWFVDTSDIDDLVHLGDYISAYETEHSAEREESTTACLEMINKLLSDDDTLYDRYVAWQGSDEYIKDFKECFNG